MIGTVKVVPAGGEVPTAAADRRTVKKEVKSWVADNRRDAKVEPPKGTVLAGSDTGTHVLQAFFPRRARVKAGGSLTFRLTGGTSEGHTITFGPKPYLDDLMAKYVLPTADFNPLGVYPSDRRPLVLTGANHGNGFLNSGLIDKDRVTPFGDKVTIRFTKKGTYPYVCLLHPGMVGEVVVR
jgi:plastocyanin